MNVKLNLYKMKNLKTLDTQELEIINGGNSIIDCIPPYPDPYPDPYPFPDPNPFPDPYPFPYPYPMPLPW